MLFYCEGVIRLEERKKKVVKEYKKLIDTTNSVIGTFEQDIRFLQGVLLGLFYGIVGNIFASHCYGMLQGLVSNSFDTLFWINLIVSIGSMVLIIIVSRKYYTKHRKIKAIKERLKDVVSELSKKYLIAKSSNS